MAGMFRYTGTNFSKAISPGGSSAFEINMIDEAQNVPRTYLQKVKVSVLSSQANDVSYMVHASSTDTNSVQDIITAQAVPAGGGTVWLSIKRTIKDDDFVSDRSDGAVCIWVRSSVPSQADIVAECWGKFIQVRPL